MHLVISRALQLVGRYEMSFASIVHNIPLYEAGRNRLFSLNSGLSHAVAMIHFVSLLNNNKL